MNPRPVSAAMTSAALIVTLGATTPAAGQPAGPSSQGPMVLQPIDNPVVFSPDVKITNVAGTTGVLFGGYAGVYMDRTVLIGGAGYWIVDPLDTIHMGYGGLLLGWRLVEGGAFSLSVRDLVGGGTATIWPAGYPVYPGYPGPAPGPRHAGYGGYPGYWMNFFVTEPEVRAQIAFGPGVSLDAGIGYRVTASGWGYGSSDLLNGTTGSIGVRFSFGR